MMKKKNRMLVCEDGFTVSVQASGTNYCEPRDNSGPYVSVELGFPSNPESLITPWAEDPDSLTNTVYGWVPSDIVLELITKHGGIKDGELPPMEYAAWDGQVPGI